jgi:hypothetical protein
MPYGKGIANNLDSAFMSGFKFDYNAPQVIDGWEFFTLDTSILVEMDYATKNIRGDFFEKNSVSKTCVHITELSKHDLNDIHNIISKLTLDFPSTITLQNMFFNNGVHKGFVLSCDDFHLFSSPGKEVVFDELPLVYQAYVTFEITGVKRNIETGQYYVDRKLVNYKLYHPLKDHATRNSTDCKKINFHDIESVSETEDHECEENVKIEGYDSTTEEEDY